MRHLLLSKTCLWQKAISKSKVALLFFKCGMAWCCSCSLALNPSSLSSRNISTKDWKISLLVGKSVHVSHSLHRLLAEVSGFWLGGGLGFYNSCRHLGFYTQFQFNLNSPMIILFSSGSYVWESQDRNGFLKTVPWWQGICTLPRYPLASYHLTNTSKSGDCHENIPLASFSSLSLSFSFCVCTYVFRCVCVWCP